MKTPFCLCVLVPLLITPTQAQEVPHRRSHTTSSVAAAVNPAKPAVAEPALPPLPAGVSQLKFSEIFKMPFGNYGPQFTEKAQSLDGKKVRILGYMVKEDTSPDTCNPNAPRNRPGWMSSVIPGRLMLTPDAVGTSMSHYALCDDLPAQTIFVTVPERYGEQVPYCKGLLLLTGTISLGNKNEADGRISAIRLLLDPAPVAETTGKPTQISMSSGQP